VNRARRRPVATSHAVIVVVEETQCAATGALFLKRFPRTIQLVKDRLAGLTK
jgi:hypothetical protein